MNPKPRPRFFVGIDSDGCAFDAMEIKHKECFTPNTILHWKLQPVSKYARQTADFVNLYSCWRGGNRWPSLVKVLELLAEHPEVRERGFRVPEPVALRQFVASGFPLSDVGLADYRRQYPDLELETAAAWSAGVNQSIATMVHGVPPFPGVRETLQLMKPTAELMVASATPVEALQREWNEHGLAEFMTVIAGQEQGTKRQHLETFAKGNYPDDHILLIGDAPADRDTARAAGVLYYPINPGYEAESWRRLANEAYPRFLNLTYAGAYETARIAEFEALLPTTPPWRKS